jgi:hypothetical protein
MATAFTLKGETSAGKAPKVKAPRNSDFDLFEF